MVHTCGTVVRSTGTVLLKMHTHTDTHAPSPLSGTHPFTFSFSLNTAGAGFVGRTGLCFTMFVATNATIIPLLERFARFSTDSFVVIADPRGPCIKVVPFFAIVVLSSGDQPNFTNVHQRIGYIGLIAVQRHFIDMGSIDCGVVLQGIELKSKQRRH